LVSADTKRKRARTGLLLEAQKIWGESERAFTNRGCNPILMFSQSRAGGDDKNPSVLRLSLPGELLSTTKMAVAMSAPRDDISDSYYQYSFLYRCSSRIPMSL